MKNNTRVVDRPRLTWPPAVRAAAAIIATAGIALLAVPGGSAAASQVTKLGSTFSRTSSSSGPAPSTRAENLAFARCMRSNGVVNYPDPDVHGELVKETPQQLGVSLSRFDSAQRACQHILPDTTIPAPTAAMVQLAMSAMVRFSGCMRSHGVPGWPDPTIGPHGRPVFTLPTIDPSSPLVATATHDCLHLMPQNTTPYVCSRALAEQIGGPPGALACSGGSPSVP